MTTPTTDKAAKPNARRIKQLVRRSLRERTRGAHHYNKAATALQQAISAGLTEGQAVEMEISDEATGQKKTVEFELVNNFAGEKAFRNATIPKFELKKVPKNPRSKSSVVASDVSAEPEAA